MEIGGTQPVLNLNNNLQAGGATTSGSVIGSAAGDQITGGATLNGSISPSGGGATLGAAGLPGAGGTGADQVSSEQLSAAETSFASVIFSLVQQMMSEAQNNSGS